jgi:hypothetical protein
MNKHHVRYKGQPEEQEDWELEIASAYHKALSHIQRSKATDELYARIINNMHSL